MEKDEGSKIKDISGWGSDLEFKTRPGHPAWKRPEEGTGAHWKNPVLQNLTFREFHSTERARVTPVFGTSVPPKGLSGLVRRVAYSYPETGKVHWITLLIADRINVIEGVMDDLIHGHIPHVYKEMGGPAEWKYNKRGFQKKLILGSVIILAIPAFFTLKKNRVS